MEVDVLCCILFEKLRATVRSGVLRMAAIFTGRARNRMGSAAARSSFGANGLFLF